MAILALLYSLSAYSIETIISGKAEWFKGEKISFSKYGDYISNIEVVLSSAIVDSSGEFQLLFDLKDTISGKIEIGYQESGFIICPGTDYQIHINSRSITRLSQALNPFIEKASLSIRIIQPEGIELNGEISEFLTLLDTFLLLNKTNIVVSQYKNAYDSLVLVLAERFPGNESSFLGKYIRYKLASFDGLVHRLTEEQAAKRYFMESRVLYSNPSYMESFNQFFEGYLQRNSIKIPKTDLVYCINKLTSFKALTDSAGKDKILRNEELRELVLLKALSELFYSKDYDKSKILKMLREAAQSKFSEHREICRNLENSLMQMQTGAFLPDFNLQNQSGITINRESFKGQFIYISFVTTWCEGCLRELIYIEKLKEKYKGKVEFVTIVCNEDYAYMKNFLKNHLSWNWTFLSLDLNAGLLKDFKTKAFPDFVFADKEGKVLSYPAKKPSEGIEVVIERVLAGK